MVESDIIVKEIIIKCWKLVLTALAGLVTVDSVNCCYSPNLFHIKCPYMSD